MIDPELRERDLALMGREHVLRELLAHDGYEILMSLVMDRLTRAMRYQEREEQMIDFHSRRGEIQALRTIIGNTVEDSLIGAEINRVRQERNRLGAGLR
jgi:hypothetical protein